MSVARGAVNEISVWRVEWWRLVRTRRLLVLLAVFVFFGFAEPFAAKYVAQIVQHAGGTQRIKIEIPPPVPADGIGGYVNNAMLIGLIVSVVIAAYACAIDANPALSAFYRTRARRFSVVLLPRVAVTAAGIAGAYVVGLLVAWYETAVLIGAPDVPAMLYSALLGALYLVFAVSVTALAGSMARSALGAVGITLAFLLACPLIGTLPGVAPWMPSELVSASDTLLRHTAVDHYPRAVAVTVVLLAAALVLASVRGARREVG
jgi:ABC-2 type transport system permease protein